MSKVIISEGKTTNEAIEKGLKELNATKSQVEIKILEQEKRSFFDILAPRIVKVEISLKEEKNANAKSILKDSKRKLRKITQEKYRRKRF